jgi:RimJ/RimL family protein N-acetyltransferase
MTRLLDVYAHQDAIEILYRLLSERPVEANISHKSMPSLDEHRSFVYSEPYIAWYIIEDAEPVGSIYLSKQREVGIFIFAKHQGKGYGREAVGILRRLHPGRIIANVAPGNHRSILFFKRMGARHIQNSYEL